MVSFSAFSASFENDRKRETHNGGDGELLLLSILEETQDIVTDDDARLAVQLFKDTHYEDLYELFSKVEICKKGKRRRVRYGTSRDTLFTGRPKAGFKSKGEGQVFGGAARHQELHSPVMWSVVELR